MPPFFASNRANSAVVQRFSLSFSVVCFYNSCMPPITREQLAIYLDDVLSDQQSALVEQALRQSEELRHLLREIMAECDRGEHSIGGIWRRQRLTCPSRDQLGSYLLGVLDEGHRGYVEFHLNTVGCAYCFANLADLQAIQEEPSTKVQGRRRRFFESSAGILPGKRVD